MLQSLKIKNVALISSAEVEFGCGLNALTGETGAGKSIILGSLNFIMGEKAQKTMIRSGESSARVDAVFSVDDEIVFGVNELTGIEVEDGQVILTRTLKTDGKNECRVNGVVVPASILKDVAHFLVHIHGQHETESLLKPKNHISILDNFGEDKIKPILTQYQVEYNEYKNLEKRLKSLGGDDAEVARQVDLYAFQINEIESANLQKGEDETLQEQKLKMQNFEKMNLGLSQAIAYLGAEEGGVTLVKRALSQLFGVMQYDLKLEEIYNTALPLQYGLVDFEDSLQSYLDNMEFDEAEFIRVDKRLDEIKVLKRKYGTSIAEILLFMEKCRASLDLLKNSEKELEKTKSAMQEKLQRMETCAKKLSEARVEVAKNLEEQIVAQLKDLGMPSCAFKVGFSEIDQVTVAKFKSNGFDDIEFMFSANKGEPLRPLSSIISGGEMSRFMLGLKSLIASDVGTMIFDEIDTGIGGRMGLKLAEKMARLAKNSQVIVVTHLAQIASVASTHFLIKKGEAGDRTQTDITMLDENGRIEELSRMLGGIGDGACQQAKDMLGWARSLS
ncbi:MAG: DNA repair protein RecN [Firmicutes bacterium]|nr:DNA repair protein RecN [Bacillota bacterium]